MEKQIEAEFQDNSFVLLKIPYDFVPGIIEDIGNLFKFKDNAGYNIGAHYGTIELKKKLEQTIQLLKSLH